MKRPYRSFLTVSSLAWLCIVFCSVAGEKSGNQVGMDLTPVIPWDGEKLYKEKDCLKWSEVSRTQFSKQNVDEKVKFLNTKACKLSHGLECLPTEPKNGLDSEHSCQCMIGMGKNATALKGSDGKRRCHILAGLGWISECFTNVSDTPTEPGFPLPYGDARGPGADPPHQADKKDNNHKTVKYLKWNTIQHMCVPHAECREGGNYIGRRCQCLKTATFHRETGTCSDANRIKSLYYYYWNLNLLANLLVLLLPVTGFKHFFL